LVRPSLSIIGLGYVGLTTAAAFASKGFRVLGYDVDHEKVRRINKGNATFHEPGIGRLLAKALKNGFRAANDLQPADINFITVGTPSARDGAIDLRYVRSASESLGKALKFSNGYNLVVVKSTVVPGSTGEVVKPIVERASGKNFGPKLGLAVNPEFLREGAAIEDTLAPDRLVIGELDVNSGDTLENLYRSIYGARIPKLLRTNLVNAELIKYASNAFLATKVSYINMIANLCQEIPGADVEVVAKGMGMDERIGPRFLKAGAGWGGSCWPKDLRALESLYTKLGLQARILDATSGVNDAQPLALVQLARELIGELKDKRVAILGLSFKPNTDDMREAVSLKVIDHLLANGASVVGYDPLSIDNAKKVLGRRISFAPTANDALRGSDCCIIVTEWEEFTRLMPRDFLSRMRSPIVIDGRRILKPEKFAKHVRFAAIGLGESH